MQQRHIPVLGLRFWIALCLASIFGANMGDYFAHDAGLGHVAGLPFLAVAFALVLIAECFDRLAHEAWYWLGIVLVRTAATNIADYFSVDMRLPKPIVMALLAALLIVVVAAAWRLWWRTSYGAANAQRGLLQADGGYWLGMLVAGTLGTVMGDYFSHDLHLGDAQATYVLGAILAAFFLVGARGLLWTLPYYWATIVMVRAAGTVTGDWLASRNALGLSTSTAVSGVVFVAFLLLWRGRARDRVATA